MTAEVMMKEYKNMKKELTVTEFQLRQFQGVSEQGIRRSQFPDILNSKLRQQVKIFHRTFFHT